MLHFEWMRGLGNVPLRAQLLSYSCWDSGCLRPGLWVLGTILGGFRLHLLKVGRLTLSTQILVHYLRTDYIVYVLEPSGCVDGLRSYMLVLM
jgi:hypothetical protein